MTRTGRPAWLVTRRKQHEDRARLRAPTTITAASSSAPIAAIAWVSPVLGGTVTGVTGALGDAVRGLGRALEPGAA
jgi:hypothetical protein